MAEAAAGCEVIKIMTRLDMAVFQRITWTEPQGMNAATPQLHSKVLDGWYGPRLPPSSDLSRAPGQDAFRKVSTHGIER